MNGSRLTSNKVVPSAPPPVPYQSSVLPPPSDATGPKASGKAVTSLILGILSLILLGLVLGIAAVIFGHIALSNIKHRPDIYGGRGMAIAGLVMGYISIPLSLIVIAIICS